MEQEALNQNNKSNALFDSDFIETIRTLVSDIVKYDDTKKAFDFLVLLKGAIKINRKKIEENQKLNDFYKKVIVTLKFIALPLLDDDDVPDLIKYNFTKQFLINDYDLLSKFTDKLRNILLLKDRDDFKKIVSAAILENSEKITDGDTFTTIKNWLKNYISQVGLNQADVVKKTQYFVDLKKHNNITTTDEKKLTNLFNFYNILKSSSQTPEGFEGSIPVISNGKLFILKQGVMQDVPDISKEYNKLNRLLNNNQTISLNDNNLDELKKMVTSYPIGSFERKAIEEEIDRITRNS
jgi:hypothetical protein